MPVEEGAAFEVMGALRRDGAVHGAVDVSEDGVDEAFTAEEATGASGMHGVVDGTVDGSEDGNVDGVDGASV